MMPQDGDGCHQDTRMKCPHSPQLWVVYGVGWGCMDLQEILRGNKRTSFCPMKDMKVAMELVYCIYQYVRISSDTPIQHHHMDHLGSEDEDLRIKTAVSVGNQFCFQGFHPLVIQHSYGKSPFYKLVNHRDEWIIFHSKLLHYQRVYNKWVEFPKTVLCISVLLVGSG